MPATMEQGTATKAMKAMKRGMLEDAKLETHDAQVRESQSVDEHHAKELYITTLLDRIKQYEDGSLTIVQDDEYIKDLNRAIDEKDAYIAKQNDIIKDLVKKNAIVVKENEHLHAEVQALRNELAKHHAESHQGDMNCSIQINDLEAERNVL